MLLLPADINQKTGFDQIISLLSSFCKTENGKKQCFNLKPVSDKEEVNILNRETAEMILLLNAVIIPDLGNIDLIHSNRNEITKEGSIPTTDILSEIKHLCNDTLAFVHVFDELKTSFPILAQKREALSIPMELLQYLNKILDEEGQIKPDASPELSRIIRNIISKEKEVRKILHSKFELARKNGWAGDTEITIRNERLVLPIIAEFKKQIKGFVHDESATGKFLYIEPIESFEENNRLKELYISKHKEIVRILRDAGKLLKNAKYGLDTMFDFLCYFDFVFAKAKLADLLNANMPEEKLSPGVKLLNAGHPALKLHFKNTESELVLNDVHLDSQNRLLLISGPNAGGKSVLLKTLILLQMMYQSGLHITSSSASEMHVFSKIFVEISDSQSIENALSTFSGHLLNMKGILENADSDTLLAIDELGSGTDPFLAAPLAEAMLEEIVNSGAWGLITTHLGSLKQVPGGLKGIENAGMQYHPEEYRPLYKLVPGIPGSSYAMELAHSIGIPENVLENAKLKLKDLKGIEVEDLTLRLEKATFDLNQSKRRIESKEKHLQILQEEYTNLKESIQNQKREILKQAREDAISLYKKAEFELKNIQKLIRNLPSESVEEISQLKKKLKQKSDSQIKELNIINKGSSVKYDELIHQDKIPQKGDIALLEPGFEKVEILEVKGKQSLIAMGELHSWVLTERLKVLKQQSKKHEKTKSRTIKIENSDLSFRFSLDIRGERGEVAMRKLEKWLDDSILSGFQKLSLVHGKGEGILKRLSYDLLKSHPGVKNFYFQSEERGGEGVTEIELK